MKPFQENEKFTRVHNYLIDKIMPIVKPNAWKVLCCILRSTSGWVMDNGTRKLTDRLSYSQLLKKTGIKNRNTLSAAIAELVERNLISLAPGEGWEANEYGINWDYEVASTEIVLLDEVASTKTVPTPSTEIVPAPSTKIVPTKERERNSLKKTDKGVAVTPPAPSFAPIIETKPYPNGTAPQTVNTDTPYGSRSRLTPTPDSAPPPPPAKKRARKTNPELFNHPFVAVWRDVFRLNLPEAKMVQLSRIAVTPTALTQWRAACEAWVLRPYDPTNIGGILDWYNDPARYQSRQSNGRGNYRTPTAAPVSPYIAMSEADKAAYLASCEPMED